MQTPKLFMLLLGCKPKGRHTEQHDIFFGIATELKELKDEILHFWPEAEGKIHIDAWREVNYVNGYFIQAVPSETPRANNLKLFFLNLGGYKPNDFEEYHYKQLAVSETQTEAIREAKNTSFFKHLDLPSAHTHIDDKYGLDVDDLYEVEDILSKQTKARYQLIATPANPTGQDEINIGYLKLSKL